jgi:hypothetical protein
MVAAASPDNNTHQVSSEAHGGHSWPQHLFEHFGPIIFFIGCFVVMCTVPLVTSGMFAAADTAPVVNSATVPWEYGLAILSAFVGAGCIVVWAPRILAPYLLILAVLGLIFPGSHLAWAQGASIAVGFLGLAVLGMGFISPK